MDYKEKFISLINDKTLPIEQRKKLEEIYNSCVESEDGELKETKQAPKTKWTEEERKAFEAALGTAWQKYCDGARLVDRFEENYIECAFSKGFLQGYIAAKQTSTKEK